jgi:hypothetical protein
VGTGSNPQSVFNLQLCLWIFTNLVVGFRNCNLFYFLEKVKIRNFYGLVLAQKLVFLKKVRIVTTLTESNLDFFFCFSKPILFPYFYMRKVNTRPLGAYAYFYFKFEKKIFFRWQEKFLLVMRS